MKYNWIIVREIKKEDFRYPSPMLRYLSYINNQGINFNYFLTVSINTTRLLKKQIVS
jgi:hypothetical protein